MLVKIKGAGGAWTLFDNAEQVQFTTDFKDYHSQADFEDSLPSPNTSLIYILPGLDLADPESYPIVAASIQFIRQGKEHVVFFNSIAYICNDHGKTVEKINFVK